MRSLSARLLIPLGLGLVLLIAAGGVAISVLVRETLRESFDEALTSEAQALGARLEIEVDPALRPRITKLGASVLSGLEARGETAPSEAERAELLRLAREGFRIRLLSADRFAPEYARAERPAYFEILGADGARLAASPSLGETRLVGEVDGVDDAVLRNLTLPDGRAGRAAFVRVSDVGFPRVAWTRAWESIAGGEALPATTALVVVARDVDEQAALLAALNAALVLAGVLLLAAVAALVWLATTRALAPLRQLRVQVERLDADSLHERVHLADAPRELVPVLEGLNESLDRLERAFERERRTASHIAHELRTPIAELQGITDVARQWPDDEALQARCVEQGHEIAEHMARIVSALLRVARSGSTPALLSAQLDLRALVDGLWRRNAGAAAERRQELVLDVPRRLAVHSDPEVVETLVANLLRNAIDHAPPGSAIRCAARPLSGEQVELTIANPCTDLAPDDLPSVTEPFWRRDEARTRSLQGGLGLPLVSELARSAELGFTLTLTDGTFTACLTFPRGADLDSGDAQGEARSGAL